MALEITLVKTPGNIVLPRNNHIFDHRGGTFGRADTNTWVLPDPEKFLSSCHCEIVFAGNQFYLEDKSTNGTFINGGFEPLGRGIRHPLRDGDFFEIGDYRFSIQLLAQLQDNFSSPFGLTSESLSNVAPFNAPPNADLFASGAPDAPSFFDQEQDPLALWGKHPKAGLSPFEQEHNYLHEREHNSLLDDFVGIDKSANSSNFSSMDIGSGIDQAVAWPSAKTESLIPEDWADDPISPLLNSSAPASFANDISSRDDYSPFEGRPVVAAKEVSFEAPRPGVRIPLAERIFGNGSSPEAAMPAHSISPAEESASSLSSVNTRPVELEAFSNGPVPQPVLESTVSAIKTNAADQTLIEALGLDRSRLSDEDIIEISRVTGMLMREIVDGMLGVLRSRASIKNEFRMNVTTIQPVENNPLKFSVCVDDALENLFIKKSNAYKKPLEAFREGFQEIAEHQLAMIAGIRQGFESMMERFDPEHLEKIFNKQSKGSVIPGVQKAKFWSGYTEYYQGFTDNMDFSFQHLFGSDFVTAYEDQLRRLTAARTRGDARNE